MTHNLKVKVEYVDYPVVTYPQVTAEKDFTVVVRDLCEPPTLTATSLAGQTYTIAYPALDSPAFAAFTVSPTFC